MAERFISGVTFALVSFLACPIGAQEENAAASGMTIGLPGASPAQQAAMMRIRAQAQKARQDAGAAAVARSAKIALEQKVTNRTLEEAREIRELKQKAGEKYGNARPITTSAWDRLASGHTARAAISGENAAASGMTSGLPGVSPAQQAILIHIRAQARKARREAEAAAVARSAKKALEQKVTNRTLEEARETRELKQKAGDNYRRQKPPAQATSMLGTAPPPVTANQ